MSPRLPIGVAQRVSLPLTVASIEIQSGARCGSRVIVRYLEHPPGSGEVQETPGQQRCDSSHLPRFVQTNRKHREIETSAMNAAGADEDLARPQLDPAPPLPQPGEEGGILHLPTTFLTNQGESGTGSCYALPPHGKGKTTQASRPPQ